MAFYISKRKLRPKEEEDMGELNIVPYLDILMNLIIFMLLSMTGLATFGILNVAAPNYGSAGAASGDTNEKPLLLTVAISKKGYFIAATGAVLPGIAEGGAPAVDGNPTLPLKKDGTLDFDGLTEKMKEVKQAFPAETKVIIAAEADGTYENLIATMDAVRETRDRKLLFPDVTLGEF